MCVMVLIVRCIHCLLFLFKARGIGVRYTKTRKERAPTGRRIKGSIFQFQFIWAVCGFYFKAPFGNSLKVDPTLSLYFATLYKKPCLQEAIVNL